MNKKEAETLIETIKGFITDDRAHLGKGWTPAELPPAAKGPVNNTPLSDRTPAPGGKLSIDTDQLEAIYRAIKNRLIDDLRIDPVLVQLLAARPEIELLIEPRIVQLEASSLKGRVARLVAAGWFAEGRATSAVRRELARTGADPGGGGSLSQKLAELQREGFLTSEGERWTVAAGIKITEKAIAV